MRVLGGPRDHRQQIPSHVDLAGPELHEGKVAERREVALEVLDHALDDTRTVVRILEVGGDGSTPTEQQTIVSRQPKVRVNELRVPALHLLPRRKQRSKLLVG